LNRWCKRFLHLKIRDEFGSSKLEAMKYAPSLLISIFIIAAACGANPSVAQKAAAGNKPVGGSCEGCEAIYESPVPFEKLNATDTFPDFNEKGPKLVISGIVYQSNGKTLAADVVLYAYHTDQQGIYPTKGNEKGWDKRHGYLRAWVKTDKEGRYTFYTLKPAPYPGQDAPAHIHITVKEPGKNEYYIAEYLFEDDPLLARHPPAKAPRGGSGVLKLRKEEDHYYATRDIVLGRNVPDYPVAGK
jgi:protocatechuate 3,4-dioxygenase beta subunit